MNIYKYKFEKVDHYQAIMANVVEFRLDSDRVRLYNNHFTICVYNDGKIASYLNPGNKSKLAKSQEYFNSQKDSMLFAYDPVSCASRGLSIEEEFEWNEYLIVRLHNIIKNKSESCVFRVIDGVFQYCRIVTSLASILLGDYDFLTINGNSYTGVSITSAKFPEIDNPFCKFNRLLEIEGGRLLLDYCIQYIERNIVGNMMNLMRERAMDSYLLEFCKRARAGTPNPDEKNLYHAYEILVDELRTIGYIPKNECPFTFISFRRSNTKSARS